MATVLEEYEKIDLYPKLLKFMKFMNKTTTKCWISYTKR